MKRIVQPARCLRGVISVPGDKSISHRAIMLGALATGVTKIKNLLDCDDCNYTIHAFREMGVEIIRLKSGAIVKGNGLRSLKKPGRPIYVGESGTSMRILAGVLAGQDFPATITGAEGLLRRPMNRVVEPLSKMGVNIVSAKGGCPPLFIHGGRVRAIDYRMPVPSAQVKSAILFAGLYAKGVTRVTEKFKSRDHTERMMKLFGADIKVAGNRISLRGPVELKARTVEVPGDISSASFFMAGAAILEGSRVRIKNVSVNPTRSGMLTVLSKMGAGVRVIGKHNGFEPCADIEVSYAPLKGIEIGESMIPLLIDELPAIFVLASAARGRTVIRGAGELKVKETDRIASMRSNLTAMGVSMKVRGSDVVIDGAGKLRGARLKSFGDHRTCMSMAMAALSAYGESLIENTGCVDKSFPGFFSTLNKLIKR